MKKVTPLILPIKGKWFYMILSGRKKEEYRERKDYWKTRFEKYFQWGYGTVDDSQTKPEWQFLAPEKEIIFRNGYRKNAPEFTAVVKITEKQGNPEWGAIPGKVYYTLQILRIYDVNL